MTHDPSPAAGLDPGQLRAAVAPPLPRRALGRGTLVLLVLLRAYVVVAVPLVGYAFVHALRTIPHEARSGSKAAAPPSATRRGSSSSASG